MSAHIDVDAQHLQYSLQCANSNELSQSNGFLQRLDENYNNSTSVYMHKRRHACNSLAFKGMYVPSPENKDYKNKDGIEYVYIQFVTKYNIYLQLNQSQENFNNNSNNNNHILHKLTKVSTIAIPVTKSIEHALVNIHADRWSVCMCRLIAEDFDDEISQCDDISVHDDDPVRYQGLCIF